MKIVYLPAKPKKRNRIARVAAAVLVCAAGVFAASMTSQSNRSYFIDTVKLWTGNDTNIIIENDGNNEKYFSFSNNIEYFTLFCTTVEFLIMESYCIKSIHNKNVIQPEL